jgi:uncharacterized protein YukE
MTDDKECFVIGPIGEPESEIREHSDRVLEYVIEDAVEEYGYNAIRADDISEPGIITTQIIEHIMESPLVIADLTNHNPNVFYELAVRHAARRPVIQLIDSDEEIPFDIANTRTVNFTLSDIEAYEGAKAEIKEQIENIESGDDNVDNPVSVAVDLQLWRESGDPKQENLADVVEMINSVQTSIRELESSIEDSKNDSEIDNKIKRINNMTTDLEKEIIGFGDAMHSSMNEKDEENFERIQNKVVELKQEVGVLERMARSEDRGLKDFM